MRRPLPLILPPLLAALAALAAAGCALPAHWPLTPAETKARLARDAGRPLPQDALPRLTAPPVPLPAGKDGRLKLSIEQVAVYTLRANRDLAVQQFQPAIAGAFRQIEAGVFDPQLYASLVHERENSREYSSSSGTYREDATGNQAAVGLSQKLPSGTTLDLSLSQDLDTSKQEPDQHQARAGLTITQALLRGFGPAVNRFNRISLR